MDFGCDRKNSGTAEQFQCPADVFIGFISQFLGLLELVQCLFHLITVEIQTADAVPEQTVVRREFNPLKAKHEGDVRVFPLEFIEVAQGRKSFGVFGVAL